MTAGLGDGQPGGAIVPLALGGALWAGSRPRRDAAGAGATAVAARRALGQPARPASLLVEAGATPAGRLLLGVPALAGPAWLAAETAQSLVVVGPTQSGKTTSPGRTGHPRLARPGAWPPASRATSSVTPSGRGRAIGRVWCIDPTGCTRGPTDVWSPLDGCRDWRHACRAAADLCRGAKAEGTTADGDFWYATAAKLLAPLLLAAALDGRTMADVVRWVDTQEVGEVAEILERAAPAEVLDAARATWCRDDRTRSSIYTTAETVLAPFAHASRESSAPPRFDPPALLGGAHTLYLCAPAHDQRRLRGYFTALTQQVLTLAFERATALGPAPRPAAPRRAGRGGTHRPVGRARRAGGHLRVPRDPDRHDLAGPGPGEGPLRRPGADRVEQPPGQAVPARASPTRTRSSTPAGSSGTRRSTHAVGDPRLRRAGARPRRRTGRDGSCRPRSSAACHAGPAVLVYGTLPPARLQLRPWWAGPQRRHVRCVDRN